MDNNTLRRHRKVVVAGFVVIVVWGAACLFDRSGQGHTDPLFEPDYTIQHAPENGTLAAAGFQQGDSVVSVEGIPVVELGMYSRWPRSLSRRPGESLTMVVERNDQLVSGNIVFRARSSGNVKMSLGAMAIILSFVGGGLWALFSTQSIHAVRLAYIGLALGAGVPGPYLGSWDGAATHFQIAVLVLWTLLILRFFVRFPKLKRIGQSGLATGLIYGAWAALLFCLVLELVFHPRLYHTFGPLHGLLMFVFSILAVAAVIHTMVTTPRDELHASGMSIILVGAVAALVPTLVAAIDWMFLWNFDIPGSNWFPLLLGVIPLTMAWAVRKHALA